MWRSPLPLQLGLVIALGLVAVLPGLGTRGLWNPVEPRYAAIASELERGGDLVAPRYNGEAYDQKPPLFFWLGALCLHLAPEGSALAAVRLPSALGLVALAAGVVLLGRRLWGGAAGLWAGLITLGSWHLAWSGRFCHMDTLLTATLVWGPLSLWSASVSAGRRRQSWVALAMLCLLAGLLLKGPATLLLTAGIFAGTALWQRDRAWLGRTGLVSAVLVALLMGGIWLGLALQRSGWAWAEELVLRQGLGRLLDATQPRKHGSLYYLVVLWGVVGPWSLLLPSALWHALRRGGAPAADRVGLRLCLLWLLLALVVLLLGETRRSRYLLPALPACALLGGWLLERRILPEPGARGARLAATLSILYAFLLTAGGGLLLVAPGWLAGLVPARYPPLAEGLQEVAAAQPLPLVWGLLAWTLGFLSLLGQIRRRRRLALALAVSALVSLVLAWGLVGAPAADRVRGDRVLVAELQAQASQGRRVLVVGRLGERESAPGFLAFHLGQTVECRAEGEEQLHILRTGEPVLVVLRHRCRPRYAEELEGWIPVRDTPLGHDRLWLYINPWPPAEEDLR